jgi:phosphoribosylanthranilate isomerase
MSVRVKICGLCRCEDAAAAAAAGADYIGVILASGFPRSRDVEEAAQIFVAAGRALRVGVFVDDDVAWIIAVAQRLLLDVVQLHGVESEEIVASIRGAGPWQLWKTLRPRTVDELEQQAARYAGAIDGLLLDGWSDRGVGGVNARFDWRALAEARRRLPNDLPVIVAGGLAPESVAQAVRVLEPGVVDVSSGVEEVLGRKSPEKMRAFVAAARSSSIAELER